MASTVMGSFMFTGLVEPFQVAGRPQAPPADASRQRYFTMLRDAIVAIGGTEVKNTGDGLMVAFDSASKAVSCASSMQQRIELHNRETGLEHLALRIGISSGDADQEDGDYFGTCVVEAARLCAVAAGGEILATKAVAAMAARHPAQRFVPRGNLELKGLPSPVAVLEVAWERGTVTGGMPLPARLVRYATEGPFPFSGRATELSRLEELRKRSATEMRLHALFVSGEAGIGKSALVAHGALAAHDAGATVLAGHCDEDLAVPYQPWIEALSQLVTHHGPPLVDRLAPPQRTALARLNPSLALAPSSEYGDPNVERLVMMEAVSALLRLASVGAPVLVVLDDLHCADAATLQLLRHLIGSTWSMPVAVVATYRDTDLSRAHPLSALLADLHRERGVARVHLSGLADVEVLELISTAAGHDLGDEGTAFAHALRRETDGNPFFTVELLRNLAESGSFQRKADGRWEMDRGTELGLPGSVREVVAHRVARLGDQAGRVLPIAAVIGREFDVEILAAVAETDEDALLDVLDEAARAAVVVEDERAPGRYRFTHALFQHTLYQDLSAMRRARTHERVAHALEGLDSDDAGRVAELAHHWLAATRPADLDRALEYVHRAAQAALAALAPDDAIRWYSQALELAARRSPPDEALHAALLIGLGDAQHQAGRPGHRDTLLAAAEIAQRLGDTDLLVAAAVAGTRGSGGMAAIDEARFAVTRAALESVGSGDSVARVLLLATACEHGDLLHWQRRRDWARETIEIARRLGDEPALLRALTGSYLSLAQPETLPARLDDTVETIMVADRLGDQAASFYARYCRVHACMEATDVDEADKRLREMEAIAMVTGLPYHSWLVQLSRSWRSLLAGQIDDAESSADAALEMGTDIDVPEALVASGALLFEIRRHQGRLSELVDGFTQVAADNAEIPALRAALTLLYFELGRTVEARDLFDRDVAAGFADFPRDVTWLTAMIMCADNAADLHDDIAAPLLYDLLSPFASMVAFTYGTVHGAVSRALGRLATRRGQLSEADQHFGEALEIHRRIGAPLWTARTELDRADSLLERPKPHDWGEVRRLAGDALEIARAHRCPPLIARASALLDEIDRSEGGQSMV